MTIPAIIAIGVAVLFAVGVEVAERRRTTRLLDRPCAGVHWHQRFPDVPHDDIRKFLHLFTDAFNFDSVHATKFGPDDQPQEIYHSRYVPHLMIDDHLEFEMLSLGLNETYGIDLRGVWHDGMTLGELFVLSRDDATSPEDPMTGPAGSE